MCSSFPKFSTVFYRIFKNFMKVFHRVFHSLSLFSKIFLSFAKFYSGYVFLSFSIFVFQSSQNFLKFSGVSHQVSFCFPQYSDAMKSVMLHSRVKITHASTQTWFLNGASRRTNNPMTLFFKPSICDLV